MESRESLLAQSRSGWSKVLAKLLLATSITTGAYFVGDNLGAHVVAPVVSEYACDHNYLQSEPLVTSSEGRGSGDSMSRSECKLVTSTTIRDGIGDISFYAGIALGIVSFSKGYGLQLNSTLRRDDVEPGAPKPVTDEGR